MLSVIVAAADNDVIGHEGQLPWHLPGDIWRFRRLTLGHPVVMGRRTYESVGRPLPGRTNIVITSTAIDGVLTASSLADALEKAKQAPGSEETFVIGGARLYREALAVANRAYVTRVHAEVTGDTYLPAIGPDWSVLEREPGPTGEQYTYTYFTYTRQV